MPVQIILDKNILNTFSENYLKYHCNSFTKKSLKESENK